MITAVAAMSIGVFIFALRMFGVIRVAAGVLVIAQDAVAVMRDRSLCDRRREKQLQQASLKLLGAFVSMLIRSVLALATSLATIFFAGLLGWVKVGEVIRYLSRWDVIAITTALFVTGYVALVNLRSSSLSAPQVNYSVLERLLHRVAFFTPAIQLTAADIENRVFGAHYQKATAEKPIFITSLPRAGTTLMLEVLHRFPSLATHTYRDMPFVMAPILWSRLSSMFEKSDEIRERAHGDGMQYGYDSPEAFEEVLWRTFWPEKYTDTGIELWSASDIKDEAHAFFVEHMKKIITLRRADRAHDGRYVSKNNANIARLGLINRMFPDAKILVPVRRPAEHAASLLRQHRNFVEMHRDAPFSRRYMADIGHYEFGELHRPIAYPGIFELLSDRDPLSTDYWLAYWIAAFAYIFEQRNKFMFISYEATCAGGASALAEICAKLEIQEEGMVDKAAGFFHAPSAQRSERTDFDDKLLEQAEELHKAIIAC